jgi:hypothetical protein
MKFRDWGKVRERNDQFFRLKLFEHVPEILRRSHTLQGKRRRRGSAGKAGGNGSRSSRPSCTSNLSLLLEN